MSKNEQLPPINSLAAIQNLDSLAVFDALPNSVFFNDLDRRTLRLLMQTTTGVELYAGHKFIPPQHHTTLDKHLATLVIMFMQCADVRHALDDPQSNPARTAFVTETLRGILVHDPEYLGEALTFLEKSTLGKDMDEFEPVLRNFESDISALSYEVATIVALQNDPAASKAYLDYIKKRQKIFIEGKAMIAQNGNLLADLPNHFKTTTSFFRCYRDEKLKQNKLTAEAAQNLELHLAQLDMLADHDKRKKVPSALMVKALDYNDPYYAYWGIERSDNPALGGLSVDYATSRFLTNGIKRSEKLLPDLIQLVRNDYEDLWPFASFAQNMAAEKVWQYLTCASDIVYVGTPPENEPQAQYSSQQALNDYLVAAREIHQNRRANGHADPLSDDLVRSTKEMAALLFVLYSNDMYGVDKNHLLLSPGNAYSPIVKQSFKERMSA